jgi:hypothetical protein
MTQNTIQVGKYPCHVYFDVPYNVYILSTKKYIRKRGRMVLRVPVSAEIVESGLDWQQPLVQQFDRLVATLIPISQKKIRRVYRNVV